MIAKLCSVSWMPPDLRVLTRQLSPGDDAIVAEGLADDFLDLAVELVVTCSVLCFYASRQKFAELRILPFPMYDSSTNSICLFNERVRVGQVRWSFSLRLTGMRNVAERTFYFAHECMATSTIIC